MVQVPDSDVNRFDYSYATQYKIKIFQPWTLCLLMQLVCVACISCVFMAVFGPHIADHVLVATGSITGFRPETSTIQDDFFTSFLR